jgi:voltage-gated potassium channel
MLKKLYILFERPEDSKAASYIDLFIIILILLNTLAFILETVPSYAAKYGDLFYQFELFSVFVFSVEYIIRLLVSYENPEYPKNIKGILRYIFSPMAMIDLLAILPFYLFLLPIDLRFIRMLRLFRLFRLFKMYRYLHSLRIVKDVVTAKRDQLVLSVFLTVFMLILSSCFMYYAEHEAQPDSFTSIPSTMWWAVATLTTVGYGDMYPVTVMGKFFGAIIAILGIGLFALPTGIIASGFSESIEASKEEKNKTLTCPHCGKTHSTEEDN